jgi:ribonucleotide monophosphatase NagD (HAD superfamily)
MVTDVGGVAALLAFTGGSEPQTLGKPSRLLFEAIARAAAGRVQDLVMVGDDAEVDVSAPVALGMRGVLVKTGKYRPGDEERVTPKPTSVLESISDLPGWLDRDDT